MSRAAGLAVTGFSALASAGMALWLAAGGWVEPGTARLLAITTMVWEVPGFAAERLLLVYPHLWFLAALILDGAGRAAALPALSLIAALAGGAAAALWLATFRRHGWPAGWALVFTAGVLAHPFSLWVLSRAGADSIALVAASLLLVLLARLLRSVESRNVVLLALCLAIGLLLDPRWVLYALIVVPFLPFLAGRAWLDEAAGGLLVVALVPLAGALLFLAAAGWLFGAGPLIFLAEVGSGSVVAPAGGSSSGLAAVGWLLAATLAGAPMLALGWRRGLGRCGTLLVVAALLPAAGLLLSTVTGAAWSPADFLHVAVAGLVVGIAAGRRRLEPRSMLLLLLLGHAGGWLALGQLGDHRLLAWREAFLGWSEEETMPLATDAEAVRLAAFLAEGPATLADDRHFHAILSALGGVGPLVLPPSPAFETQLLLAEPDIEQIVMPRPGLSGIPDDRIARRHPNLWDDGLAGYRIVLAGETWRVWRRIDAPGAVVSVLPRCLKKGDQAKTLHAIRSLACPTR